MSKYELKQPARLNEQKSIQTARVLASLLSPLGDVLDVGCGEGTILQAAFESGANALAGIDVDQRWFERARVNAPSAKLDVADVQSRMPYGDASFDSIFFCDVLEHLHRPVEALCEIRRVLRAGGRLVVTTPNANSIVRRLTGERWFALSDESHVLFYTAFTLRHLLTKTGFAIQRIDKMPFTGSRIKDAILQGIGDGGTLLCIARAT